MACTHSLSMLTLYSHLAPGIPFPAGLYFHNRPVFPQPTCISAMDRKEYWERFFRISPFFLYHVRKCVPSPFKRWMGSQASIAYWGEILDGALRFLPDLTAVVSCTTRRSFTVAPLIIACSLPNLPTPRCHFLLPALFIFDVASCFLLSGLESFYLDAIIHSMLKVIFEGLMRRDESLEQATSANIAERRYMANDYTNWMTRRMYVYVLHVCSMWWSLTMASTVGLSLMPAHRLWSTTHSKLFIHYPSPGLT